MRWSWRTGGGQIIPPRVFTTIGYSEGSSVAPVQPGGATFDSHFMLATPAGTDPVTGKAYSGPLPPLEDLRRPVRLRLRLARLAASFPDGIDATHTIDVPVPTFGDTWSFSMVADRYMVPGVRYAIQLYWNEANPKPPKSWPLTIAVDSTLVVRQYESVAAAEGTLREP